MEGSMSQPKILIISETIAKSWAIDASTFALFVGLIGIGWLLNSSAMEWVGAGIGFLTILARFSGRKKAMTFTISQARAELDRLEALKSEPSTKRERAA